MSFPASQRLVAVVAIALAGSYALTRTAQVPPAPELVASAPPSHPAAEPLYFDPPAAGPSSPSSGNPAYDACIDQPSFDGAVIECQLLLQKPVKPRRR